MKFDLHFLPASYGDSILIHYGDQEEQYCMLIDGGTGGTRTAIKEKMEELATNHHLELLVVTHIDRDHIEGVLNMLRRKDLELTVSDCWFNGWPHLPGNDRYETFGAVQGEFLTAEITGREWPWNRHFNGAAVVIPEEGDLPVIKLKGGMRLTLLSPNNGLLLKLKDKWEDEVREANLEPGFGMEEPVSPTTKEVMGGDQPDIEELIKERFEEDDAPANGSSIAFIAEFEGKRVLFAADSFPSIILAGLNRLYPGNAPFDLVKLSHHGSAKNTSPALIEKLDCNRFVISTNGSLYGHPDQVTIARLIHAKGPGAELIFNYRSPFNKCWAVQSLQDWHGYTARYPEGDEGGISVSLF